MIRTITPNALDEIQFLLSCDSGSLSVYFPLFDGEPMTADYVAEISWNNDKIDYTLGGHGIGFNHVYIPHRDALIERISEDNQRFNRGNAFQIGDPGEAAPSL